METSTIRYRMNPAEDKILTGRDLEVGMLVLNEDPSMRRPHGDSEDDQLRRQCFRRVVRFIPSVSPGAICFVGEWVDGYQEVHTYHPGFAWLAKKTPAELGEDDGAA